MLKTVEYFKMSANELQIKNEYDYSREENKLLDDGLKILFYSNLSYYNENYKEDLNWYVVNGFKLKHSLEMTDGRIAMVLV